MKYLGWCQILESVLKDVDITDRRLQNMIMNGSMSKRFRFLDEFRLWHCDLPWLDLSLLKYDALRNQAKHHERCEMKLSGM